MKIESPPITITMTLVGQLFALILIWIGLQCLGPLPHLYDWWRAQYPMAIKAEVLRVALKTDVSEGTSYNVRAEFGYEFNGTHYRSTQIGAADDDSAKLADYQQLQAAKAQGRQVTLWVDPQHPEYAVFDPHVPWPTVCMQLLYGLLFVAFGLSFFYKFSKKWLARRSIGDPELHIARLPHIGMEDFTAQIHFVPALGEQALWPKTHYALQVECRCTHVDSNPEGAADKILWFDVKPYAQLPHGINVIDMVLDLRGNLPPSGKLPEKDNEIVWHLILKVFGGEVKFVLPVGAG